MHHLSKVIGFNLECGFEDKVLLEVKFNRSVDRKGSFLGLDSTRESDPLLLTSEIDFDDDTTSEFYMGDVFAGYNDLTPIYIGYGSTPAPPTPEILTSDEIQQDMRLAATGTEKAPEESSPHLTVYKDTSREDETPLIISVILDSNETPTEPMPTFEVIDSSMVVNFDPRVLGGESTTRRAPAFENLGYLFGDITNYPD